MFTDLKNYYHKKNISYGKMRNYTLTNHLIQLVVIYFFFFGHPKTFNTTSSLNNTTRMVLKKKKTR